MNASASCQSARTQLIKSANRQSLLDYPWSSVALAYAVPPSKRNTWMDVSTGLALAQCVDTVAGRRQYVRRLDERAMRVLPKRVKKS